MKYLFPKFKSLLLFSKLPKLNPMTPKCLSEKLDIPAKSKIPAPPKSKADYIILFLIHAAEKKKR